MKKLTIPKMILFVSLIIFLMPEFLLSSVIINWNSSVTYYRDGRDPISNGFHSVGNQINVSIFDSLSTRFIKEYIITGDSLLIITNENISKKPAVSIFIGNLAQFNETGIYKVFEAFESLLMDCGGKKYCSFAQLGIITIVPSFKTSPVIPTADDSITLVLIHGLSSSACPNIPQQINHTLKGNNIHLSYTMAKALGPCIDIFYDPPRPYGPSFNLGVLPAGQYILYIDESSMLGTFTVNKTLVLPGSVTEMKNPLTKSISIPVEGAIITARIFNPCGFTLYNGMVETSVVASAMSNQNGGFTLYLPDENLNYDIQVSKIGFNSQLLIKNAKDSLQFLKSELIKLGDNTLASLYVTITDKGTPVDSMSVSLMTGRQLVFCPMLNAKASGMTVSFNQFTDKNGETVFADIPLSNSIDYAYRINKYTQSGSINITGTIRLNNAKSFKNELIIDLADKVTSIKIKPGVTHIRNLSLHPNPFTESTSIQFPEIVRRGKLKVFTIDGILATHYSLTDQREFLFSNKTLDQGIYLIEVWEESILKFRSRMVIAK